MNIRFLSCILILLLCVLLSSCSENSGLNNVESLSTNNSGMLTSTDDCELSDENCSLNSNHELNIINNGTEIVIDDEDSFNLLEKIEAVIEKECTNQAVLTFPDKMSFEGIEDRQNVWQKELKLLDELKRDGIITDWYL